ncbi:2-hydroxyglutaryl-CoA dehydratase [Desulfallas sp. Bu1-1]|uniref:acyl-CoA dehydratase activase n=1 Tax=Desulfallas sp. Bu1-1 TaxID=2787620 RepID=UPI00189F8FED|nr:acyl-CoA dehydratase activase [Desulfallas sp. Bu1-1]MBF7082851.1 2-hydroxyglutaryl-CoA dehydratase [Desulfallas sp. Bu1-1]
MISKTANSIPAISKVERAALFTLGIDSGSLTAKAVIMDGNRRIVSHSVKQLEFVSEKAVKIAMDNALAAAGLELSDMAYIVSTGYGRRRFSFANKAITEISCHAKGANYVFPDARTVIDIGGQDSKVISVDPLGNVQNFAMNDTCAAGTGQFLEVMARALGVGLEKIGELSLESLTKLKISSMCTVFAESEVISLVAQGHTKADILAAIHEAIARRITGLVGRVGLRQPVIMTGGVAKNIGVVRALEKELGVSITVPGEPQIVGALGAALFALDYALAASQNQNVGTKAPGTENC